MTVTPPGADRAVRRRQILLAAGLAAGVLGIAGVGAILYEYRKPAGLLPTSSSAKTVPVTTPGGGVDPRDAWRGLEGAAIEEIRRQLAEIVVQLKLRPQQTLLPGRSLLEQGEDRLRRPLRVGDDLGLPGIRDRQLLPVVPLGENVWIAPQRGIHQWI